MRYKGDYKPQYVLDPETNEWNPLEGELRELMDKQKYVSLSREHIDKEEDRKPYLLETSLEVFKSKETLFKLGMPGMMSPEEVEAQVDLSRMRIHLSKGITVDTEVSDSCARRDLKAANINQGSCSMGERRHH